MKVLECINYYIVQEDKTKVIKAYAYLLNLKVSTQIYIPWQLIERAIRYTFGSYEFDEIRNKAHAKYQTEIRE